MQEVKIGHCIQQGIAKSNSCARKQCLQPVAELSRHHGIHEKRQQFCLPQRTKSNASARADTLLFAREDSSKVKQIADKNNKNPPSRFAHCN